MNIYIPFKQQDPDLKVQFPNRFGLVCFLPLDYFKFDHQKLRTHFAYVSIENHIYFT